MFRHALSEHTTAACRWRLNLGRAKDLSLELHDSSLGRWGRWIPYDDYLIESAYYKAKDVSAWDDSLSNFSSCSPWAQGWPAATTGDLESSVGPSMQPFLGISSLTFHHGHYCYGHDLESKLKDAVMASSLFGQLPNLLVLNLETVSVCNLRDDSDRNGASGDALNSHSVQLLAAALSHLPLLQKLYLSGLGLEDECMVVLSPILRSLVHLKHLELRHNYLGLDSMESMVEYMRDLPHLEFLGLTHNKFIWTPDGNEYNLYDPSTRFTNTMKSVTLFASSLKHLSRLVTLDLRRSHHFDPEHIEVLEKAVAQISAKLLIWPRRKCWSSEDSDYGPGHQDVNEEDWDEEEHEPDDENEQDA